MKEQKNLNLEISADDRKALDLYVEYRDVKRRAKNFVGESNCDYDGSPWGALSKKASEVVLDSATDAIEGE